MPRYPDFSDRVKAVPRSVFEDFLPVLKKHPFDLVPFHMGDTYLQPAFDLPLDKEFTRRFKYHNRYCNTYGVGALKTALLEKVNSDNGFSITDDNIIITNGAVNGLNAAVFSIVNPGEEIIVLTPCWPFFIGIVNLAQGTVNQLPFYHQMSENSFDITASLESAITEKTVAIYFNTPNNPTGQVVSTQQMQEIAAVVKTNRLWLISDESYEAFVYDDLQHISIAAECSIFEQTLTIFSFAKMFMVAGYRLGYVVGNNKALEVINKVLVHQIYSSSSLVQYIMIEPVKTRKQWLPAIRDHYLHLRDLTVQRLQVEAKKPHAGYFYFFSLEPFLGNTSFNELFMEILNHGIALTPGESFGNYYKNYVRMCFTTLPEDKLINGIDRLNRVLSPYR